MATNPVLEQAFLRDRDVWDGCARTYERQIVGGHPDVTAYEEFEEDLLEQVALFLAGECKLDFKLFDVGCGSARIHQRLGSRITERLEGIEGGRNKGFDPVLWARMKRIEGLDFSTQMIQIAREKLTACGLGPLLGKRLHLMQGSAFDLEPMADEPVPVVVSVCNSVGVMQGPEGAEQLFRAVRRAVERAQGIAIISGYRRSAVATHALANYESTLDVCGQPRWLEPDTYAGPNYIQTPHCYKRAHSKDQTLAVEVRTHRGELVKAAHQLRRDAHRVAETIASGHIQTHTDYESRWYSAEQFQAWMKECWSGLPCRHVAGKDLDALRGEPAQFAILDPAQRLAPLLQRWAIG